MPLYKSSRSQFCPMLMKIFNLPDFPVMVVAIFWGESKPHSQEEFLRQFVTEIKDLQKNHLKIQQQLYWVCLQVIFADALARSFTKWNRPYHPPIHVQIWRNPLSRVREEDAQKITWPRMSPGAWRAWYAARQLGQLGTSRIARHYGGSFIVLPHIRGQVSFWASSSRTRLRGLRQIWTVSTSQMRMWVPVLYRYYIVMSLII